MRNPDIDRKEKELVEIRRKHVTARTPKTKEKYRNLDKQIRDEISELLKAIVSPVKQLKKSPAGIRTTKTFSPSF